MMPLIAKNGLPTYERLRRSGHIVLTEKTATQQDIREQHIGLLNMMPDAALAATERQFFRLIAESNAIAQFYVHPFTLPEISREPSAQKHIDQYYETFEEIKRGGLDALIITGANVRGSELQSQDFWNPLMQVVDWAYDNVTSTLCSCLASHAVIEYRYAQQRLAQKNKIWGVFPHRVVNKSHPIVSDINTQFDVPHSRWNAITPEQFKQADLRVLVESDQGVHLATSPDGFRFVFFQGHPEYDTVSLLKEYKRDLQLFAHGRLKKCPPFPENYLGEQQKAILGEYIVRLVSAVQSDTKLPDFPEKILLEGLDNTWHDTAESVIGNWMGCVYQVTHSDRTKLFMDGVLPDNPLGLNFISQ